MGGTAASVVAGANGPTIELPDRPACGAALISAGGPAHVACGLSAAQETTALLHDCNKHDTTGEGLEGMTGHPAIGNAKGSGRRTHYIRPAVFD